MCPPLPQYSHSTQFHNKLNCVMFHTIYYFRKYFVNFFEKITRKKKMFFDNNLKIIKSRVSRIPQNAEPRSETIRRAMAREKDNDLIDFIEVSHF